MSVNCVVSVVAWPCQPGPMTARLKGRRRQASAVIDAVTQWAKEQADISALALVGSYAYDRPRMASDVDLVLITSNPYNHARGLDGLVAFDPRAGLIRDQRWGLSGNDGSGCIADSNSNSASCHRLGQRFPSTPGRRKLRDGCQILHDPQRLLQEALATL